MTLELEFPKTATQEHTNPDGSVVTITLVMSEQQSWPELTLGKNIRIGQNVRFEGNVEIGHRSWIGDNVTMRHCFIERDVTLGSRCQIGKTAKQLTYIADGAAIGADTIVSGRIGHGVTVGNSSFVFGSIKHGKIGSESVVWIAADSFTDLDSVYVGHKCIICLSTSRSSPLKKLSAGNGTVASLGFLEGKTLALGKNVKLGSITITGHDADRQFVYTCVCHIRDSMKIPNDVYLPIHCTLDSSMLIQALGQYTVIAFSKDDIQFFGPVASADMRGLLTTLVRQTLLEQEKHEKVVAHLTTKMAAAAKKAAALAESLGLA